MRYSDKFGRYLRAVRESKGYSQEYMADRLGIGQSSYACLESGRTCMTVERLIEIAAVLEVDLHAMLDKVLADSPDVVTRHAPSDPGQQELVTALRNEIDFLRQLVLRGEGQGLIERR
jgi:transcriptional regulator with XRE-family HTH domain